MVVRSVGWLFGRLVGCWVGCWVGWLGVGSVGWLLPKEMERALGSVDRKAYVISLDLSCVILQSATLVRSVGGGCSVG